MDLISPATIPVHYETHLDREEFERRFLSTVKPWTHSAFLNGEAIVGKLENEKIYLKKVSPLYRGTIPTLEATLQIKDGTVQLDGQIRQSRYEFILIALFLVPPLLDSFRQSPKGATFHTLFILIAGISLYAITDRRRRMIADIEEFIARYLSIKPKT